MEQTVRAESYFSEASSGTESELKDDSFEERFGRSEGWTQLGLPEDLSSCGGERRFCWRRERQQSVAQRGRRSQLDVGFGQHCRDLESAADALARPVLRGLVSGGRFVALFPVGCWSAQFAGTERRAKRGDQQSQNRGNGEENFESRSPAV